MKKAMEPLYTTRPELERSGMGFSFMEAFMDEVQVESEPGKGTIVRMKKIIDELTFFSRQPLKQFSQHNMIQQFFFPAFFLFQLVHKFNLMSVFLVNGFVQRLHIGEVMGISQVQVSRMEKRILRNLREML